MSWTFDEEDTTPRPSPITGKVLERWSQVPTIDDADSDMERRDIEYPDYLEGETYLVSGPLPHGGGPGRRFQTAVEAEKWARGHFGERFIGRVRESEHGGRWAVRVRRP